MKIIIHSMKLRVKRDWTMSSNFINYFTLNIEHKLPWGSMYLIKDSTNKHALLITTTKLEEVRFLLILHHRVANATQVSLHKHKLENMSNQPNNIHISYCSHIPIVEAPFILGCALHTCIEYSLLSLETVHWTHELLWSTLLVVTHNRCFLINGWQLERVSCNYWYYMTSREDHSIKMAHQSRCHIK